MSVMNKYWKHFLTITKHKVIVGVECFKRGLYRGGCKYCPQTEDVLAMGTVLYNGFGGYEVIKNGETFYRGEIDGEWESFRKLSDIEKEAKKDARSQWRVVLNNPLRGATWERIHGGKWLLIETNQGFV